MIGLLIFVIVVAVVAWVLTILVDQLPPPFNMPLKVLIVVLAIVIILYRLLPYADVPIR